MRKIIEILDVLYVQVSGLEFYKYIWLLTGTIVVTAVIICLCRKRGRKSSQTDAMAMGLKREKAPEVIPESEPDKEDWSDFFKEIEAEVIQRSKQKKNTEVVAENKVSVDVWTEDFEGIDPEFDKLLKQMKKSPKKKKKKKKKKQKSQASEQMGETQDLEVSTDEIYRYGETQE